MLTVALIEDDDAAAARLAACLDEFSNRSGERFQVIRFPEATGFIEDYRPIYDLVLMDIEMPTMNGMDAARRLREVDGEVVLIFVTNAAQYAATGYEVDALDYLVKPYQFPEFERKLRRAVRLCRQDSEAVVVKQHGGTVRVLLRDVAYIEVRGHSLLLRTEDGVVRGKGTLQEMQERLGGRGFLRCSKGFLVNQKHVRSVTGSTLTMTSGEQLAVGRAFKRSFMDELAACLGESHVI